MRSNLMPGPSGPGFFRWIAVWWGEKPLHQLGLLLAVGLIFGFLGHNTLQSMQQYGLTPGFGFLSRPANFEIGEGLIEFSARDPYWRAILVGLLNTLKVAVLGCLLATLLGVALGVARLSSNPLLSGLVQLYVELIRNTPLLLQLFFWSALIHALPGPRGAFSPIDGVFLSNRGIYVPAPALTDAGWIWDVPNLQGFNFVGGAVLSPEFATLTFGLTINIAATIAEIVRGAIQAIPAGQWEAGEALGLKRLQSMRLIILPQALRTMVPLVTSSYLNLAKGASLAVAIGFPDLVSVINTSANQTGQALETIAILMATYLILSLAVSGAMNLYNASFEKERR